MKHDYDYDYSIAQLICAAHGCDKVSTNCVHNSSRSQLSYCGLRTCT